LTLDTTVAASSFFTFFLPASRLPLVVLVIGSARLSRRVSPLSAVLDTIRSSCTPIIIDLLHLPYRTI
jgi:hypothetical protein